MVWIKGTQLTRVFGQQPICNCVTIKVRHIWTYELVLKLYLSKVDSLGLGMDPFDLTVHYYSVS